MASFMLVNQRIFGKIGFFGLVTLYVPNWLKKVHGNLAYSIVQLIQTNEIKTCFYNF